MAERITNHTISGNEKEEYLIKLEQTLEALAYNLEKQENLEYPDTLKAFGDKNGWAWDRLPNQTGTGKAISQLVRRIKDEYGWFKDIISEEYSEKNRAYFKELNISSESGLPWVFDMMELHRLKKESEHILKKIPEYQELALELKSLLMEDYAQMDEVQEKAHKLQQLALNRNFIEQIKESDLLNWQSNEHSIQPIARRRYRMGGEELWNISSIKYMPSNGMYEAYSLDIWQDILDPQMKRVDRFSAEITPELARTIKFGADNTAWYIIKSIDNKFSSLHPVHASRVLIGPFENKYLTHPDSIKPLSITKELLKDDPSAGIFRVSRQYSFAPNHEEKDGNLRQIIYRENWSDEIIACPTKYASTVSKSVLGTNIKIFEI